MGEKEEKSKISDLRVGMENVNLVVRVLEASEPRVVQTKNGPRTLSEAVVGDETGKIKLTLWGKLAGTVKEGQVVEITNAWTTAYKGKVQLNAGSKSEVKEAPDSEAPAADQIPDNTPSAPQQQRGFRGGGGRRGGRGRRFGGRRESGEGGEEE
ncbi:MAG: OB-fold nucleic acid binding domain-containing protein [Sulfolobaceae archaeon]|nr:OB-fold nucleic acid binding domain-containing protein [Sulfolobaceae archaeon]